MPIVQNTNQKPNNLEKNLLSKIEELLVHILYELPLPPINSLLSFKLPNMNIVNNVNNNNNSNNNNVSRIEIQSGLHKNLPTTNFEIHPIFNLSIENIILIHSLIILEQKLLFISTNSDYNSLTQISEVFVNLIYPLKWINTYIPVLSQDLVKYLQSFMPFIMGVDETLLKTANEYMDSEIIYVVNIKKDTVQSAKDKKKIEMKTLFKNQNLPIFPEENIKFLNKELKVIKTFWEKNKKNLTADLVNKIDYDIKDTFAKSMMILFGDYKNFTSYIDNVPFFNSNSFISHRKSMLDGFYNDFTQTQIFRHFLQLAATNSEMSYYHYFDDLYNKHRPYFAQFNFNLENNAKKDQSLTMIKGKDYTNWNLGKNVNKAESTFSKFFKKSTLDIDYRVCITETGQENNYNIGEGNEKDENIISDKKYLIASIFNETNSNTNFNSGSGSGSGELDINVNANLDSKFSSVSSKEMSTNNTIKITPPTLPNTVNTNDIYKTEIKKKIFGDNFNLDIFNDVLTTPPRFIRVYPEIESLHKYNKNNFSGGNDLPMNFIQFQNQNQENIISSDDDQAIVNSEDESNPYWKMIKKVAGIREQRKMFLSILENDEKMSKLKQQGKYYLFIILLVKRRQSLISTILTSDQKQLEIYQEQIGEIIKDEMGKLLTSNCLGKENVRDLSYILKYKYARTKFAKILFQDKFKENIRHCLDDNSFQELFEIITNALVCSQNDSQFEDIRLMTKSTLFYYKNVEQKNKSLGMYHVYQEITKKNPFNFWKQADFWKYYLDAEIDENTDSLNLTVVDIEDYYFGMIMLVARVMIDLNIDFKIICQILCYDIVRSYITKTSLINDLESTLEKIKLNSSYHFN